MVNYENYRESRLEKEIQYLIVNSLLESNLRFIFAQFYPTQKEKNA